MLALPTQTICCDWKQWSSESRTTCESHDLTRQRICHPFACKHWPKRMRTASRRNPKYSGKKNWNNTFSRHRPILRQSSKTSPQQILDSGCCEPGLHAVGWPSRSKQATPLIAPCLGDCWNRSDTGRIKTGLNHFRCIWLACSTSGLTMKCGPTLPRWLENWCGWRVGRKMPSIRATCAPMRSREFLRRRSRPEIKCGRRSI